MYFGTMRAMKSHVHIQEPADDEVSTLLTQLARAGVPDICTSEITPTCLFALYNTTKYKPTATDKNVLGVAGYLNEFVNYANMQVGA